MDTRKNVYVDIKFGDTKEFGKEWCGIALAFDDSDKIFYFERSDFDYGYAFHIESLEGTDYLLKSLMTFNTPEDEIKFVNDKDNFYVRKAKSSVIFKEIGDLITKHCGIFTPLIIYHDMPTAQVQNVSALLWIIEKDINHLLDLDVQDSFYGNNTEFISINTALILSRTITKGNAIGFDSKRLEIIDKFHDEMENSVSIIRKDDTGRSAIAKVACVKRIIGTMSNN